MKTRKLISSNSQSTATDASFLRLLEQFGVIKERIKVFRENYSYEELPEEEFVFEASTLSITDLYDDQIILEEVSKIPQKLLIYGCMYESQSKVVQLLEDEFERWYAKKYILLESVTENVIDKDGNFKGTKKLQRTATTINNLIISEFEDEYKSYQDKLSKEKYKLGLLKCVVQSLDNYSYKLHSIHNHLQKIIDKTN